MSNGNGGSDRAGEDNNGTPKGKSKGRSKSANDNQLDGLPPAPPGWSVTMSKQYSRPFWYHNVTKATSWSLPKADPPAGESNDQAGKSSGKTEKAAEIEKDRRNGRAQGSTDAGKMPGSKSPNTPDVPSGPLGEGRNEQNVVNAYAARRQRVDPGIAGLPPKPVSATEAALNSRRRGRSPSPGPNDPNKRSKVTQEQGNGQANGSGPGPNQKQIQGQALNQKQTPGQGQAQALPRPPKRSMLFCSPPKHRLAVFPLR